MESWEWGAGGTGELFGVASGVVKGTFEELTPGVGIAIINLNCFKIM